jgi:hypothetical protein
MELAPQSHAQGVHGSRATKTREPGLMTVIGLSKVGSARGAKFPFTNEAKFAVISSIGSDDDRVASWVSPWTPHARLPIRVADRALGNLRIPLIILRPRLGHQKKTPRRRGVYSQRAEGTGLEPATP